MGAETGPKIVEYARSKKRTKVGSGECFDLAVAALKDAGQKTAYDFGEVTDTADYKWGTEVPLAGIQAGDIIQYRDYSFTQSRLVVSLYTLPDGMTLTTTDKPAGPTTRPHHTAIATGSPVNGAVKVLEQNVERVRGRGYEKLVDDGEIYIQGQPEKTTTRTETVRIDIPWGVKIKKYFGPKEAASIDGLVRKNLGKNASVDITVTESIVISGTLKAYRAQPK